ncbi:trypsin-like peptidase domain-containing protein [Spirochaetota bacterium]
MKKKILLIIPLVAAVFILLTNQFYCKPEVDSVNLFGKMEMSPLKEKSGVTKASEIQDTFRDIFDLYKDSVVFITTEQIVRVRPHSYYSDPFFQDFFNRGRRRDRARVQKKTGLGTGFIISDDGYICTNYHVIKKVDKINININDKSYEGKIIGTDERTDIALLKIDTKKKLKPVYFGDSDNVKVGNWAIAIGNPFGLDRTFTVGVISAIGRNDVDLMGGSHIQTDASINPGNSGGPLINIYGEVIGINRMIYSKSGGYMGIGFAIPINTARFVLSQLKQFQRVKRGYLGVSIIRLTDNYATQLGLKSKKGVLVGEVIPDTPAYKGGIKIGDVIVKINKIDIDNYKDLIRIIGQIPIGKKMTITVWRNRRLKKLRIKVEERPQN